ncbi:MAG: hypothetical protein WC117_00200 [Sphaerochaetaceae bacterium]
MSDELKACRHGRNFCLECHYDPASPSKTLPQMYDDLLAENAALRAQLPSQGGETVEVVAYGDKQQLNALKSECSASCAVWNAPGRNREPLMTVAQHQRILAASAGSADPAGWYTEDHLTDKSATTYDPEVAERWRAKGWPPANVQGLVEAIQSAVNSVCAPAAMTPSKAEYYKAGVREVITSINEVLTKFLGEA